MKIRGQIDAVVAAAVATVMVVITLASRPARAGESALVVVVETGLAAGCDGAAVREAVGGELGVAVVAPGELTSAQPSLDTLVVTVDRARITVALRAGNQWAARSIPAPAERSARLRAIAWLAGNLGRDQTSAILQNAAPATSSPKVASSDTTALAPTAPPPVAASLPAPAASLTVSSAEDRAPAASAARWSVTVAGGPTASPVFGLGTSVATGGTPRSFSTFSNA